MKSKKVIGYVLTGALSIGIIGGAGINAIAASNSTNTSTDTKQEQKLDSAKKQKVEAIMADAKAQLAKLGVTFPNKGERHDIFGNLDDATKTKAHAIMEKLRAGTLTETEAKAQ
ncbi:hypothetical protein CUU64_16530, partial [Bacillus sp. V5-8f]